MEASKGEQYLKELQGVPGVAGNIGLVDTTYKGKGPTGILLVS